MSISGLRENKGGEEEDVVGLRLIYRTHAERLFRPDKLASVILLVKTDTQKQMLSDILCQTNPPLQRSTLLCSETVEMYPVHLFRENNL